ncbi:MAG: DUF808 family protein, partial [Inhella sp.]
LAAIGTLDAVGMWRTHRHARGLRPRLGWGRLALAPGLMKVLGVVGTAAMFLVGGGILTHNTPALHHLLASQPWWTATAADLAVGVLAGALVLLAVSAVQAWRRPPAKP